MLKVICFSVVIACIWKLGNLQLIPLTTKYYMSNDMLDFVQSHVVCRRNGYDLLTEQNANETSQINAALKASEYSNLNLWLAGTRVTEGDFDPAWIWVESGEEFEYGNWEAGQPSGEVNCLMRLALNASSCGQWASKACISALWFICQNPEV